MQPEIALVKREQMLQDGFCFVDDILTEEFLQELREESERLIAEHVPPPDVRYQGSTLMYTVRRTTSSGDFWNGTRRGRRSRRWGSAISRAPAASSS